MLHELVKRILKLRWIGRKDEADLLLLTTFGRPGLRDNVRWRARGNFANFLESRHEPIGSR